MDTAIADRLTLEQMLDRHPRGPRAWYVSKGAAELLAIGKMPKEMLGLRVYELPTRRPILELVESTMTGSKVLERVELRQS